MKFYLNIEFSLISFALEWTDNKKRDPSQSPCPYPVSLKPVDSGNDHLQTQTFRQTYLKLIKVRPTVTGYNSGPMPSLNIGTML